jgi:hypothetical protein
MVTKPVSVTYKELRDKNRGLLSTIRASFAVTV